MITQTIKFCRLFLLPVLAVVLIVAIVMALPMAAEAAPPAQDADSPEKCATCHVAEAQAWSDSSHANALSAAEGAVHAACVDDQGAPADCDCLGCHTTDYDPVAHTYGHEGVTCEACHGTYVEGHPDSGTMTLVADDSLCQNCHSDTHEQWSSSLHATANVQCIGCHQVHSQDLRLSEADLCDSCHAGEHEGAIHTAHVGKAANCTDCHQTDAYTPDASDGASYLLVADRATPASHDFAVSSTEACIACHQIGLGIDQSVDVQAVMNQSSELAALLEQTQVEKRTAQTWAFVALGAGLGIGGLMGMVFVLAVGFVWQGRRRS